MVEEDAGIDEGGCHDLRQDEPEQRIPQNLGARPLPGRLACRFSRGSLGQHGAVAFRMPAQQAPDQRHEDEDQNARVKRPHALPGHDAKERDCQQWKDRLATGVAE